MTTDFLVYQLNCESKVTAETFGPEDYVYETKGEIVSIDDKGQETLVGKFRLFFIDIDYVNFDRVNLFWVFDSYEETEEYYHAIYSSDGSRYSEKLENLLDYDLVGNNVLILDRLEILPAFRGQKSGLIIIRRLIQRFSSGASIVAIKPHPLQFQPENVSSNKLQQQWDNEMQISKFSNNKKEAINKLKHYYRKLGFLEMQGTPFMFMSAERKLPTINELKAL